MVWTEFILKINRVEPLNVNNKLNGNHAWTEYNLNMNRVQPQNANKPNDIQGIEQSTTSKWAEDNL